MTLALAEISLPEVRCMRKNQPLSHLTDEMLTRLHRGEAIYFRCPVGMPVKVEMVIYDREEQFRYTCDEQVCDLEVLR